MEAHHCTLTRDKVRTTDQALSSQRRRVLFRSNCEFITSPNLSEYNGRKEEISGLKNGQQQPCNVQTAMSEKCVQ